MTRAKQGEVSPTICQTLGKRDQPMVASALIAALRDQDVALRRAADCILVYASARAAIEPLIAAFEDLDPQLRAWSVWPVGQSYQYLRSTVDAREIARPNVRVLENRTEAQDVRVRAAEALGRIGDDGNCSALVAILSDSREPTALRVQAAHALQGTSYRPAIDAMQAIRSRASEPQELREACMTPMEIFELHSRKLR
jgi:HEAT repeat protein